MTETLAVRGSGGNARPYSRLSIGLHWFMLLLLAAVYACIELRELYPRGSDIREGLKTWHFMLGLSVFGLVALRLVARIASPRQPGPKSWGDRLAGLAHLAQSITDILTTPIGSRVMRRDYGSNLPDLIDQPMNGFTRLRLFAATAGALQRWEPRIRVAQVEVIADPRDAQAALATITYRLVSSGQQATMNLNVPVAS